MYNFWYDGIHGTTGARWEGQFPDGNSLIPRLLILLHDSLCLPGHIFTTLMPGHLLPPSSPALTSRQQISLRSHLARHSRQGNRFTACLTGTGPLQPPRPTISYCRPITCKSSRDISSITALLTGLGRLWLNITAQLNNIQTTTWTRITIKKFYYGKYFFRDRKMLLVTTK